MTTFSKSIEVPSPIDALWDLVLNLNELKYWSSLKKIKILERKGNTIEREVTVGFLNSKGRQTLVLDPKKSTVLHMTSGNMTGKRTITLTPLSKAETKVTFDWDYKLSGMPNFAKGYVEDHIRAGTEKALAGIAEDAKVRAP